MLLTPAGDDEARRRRRLEAADLHFEAGDVERSLRVLDGAREEAPAGPARGAVLLRLGRLRAETSGAAEAVALWREALAEADGDDPLKARVLLDLGQFLRFTEGTESALAQLDEAVSVAARIGDDDLECRTRAAHALVHFNSGRGIHHDGIERALTLESALAERSPAMPATPFLVHQLVWCGEYASAREAHDRWLAWAREREHPDQGDAAWYLALLDWRHGRWDDAAAAAARAITLTEQFGRESTTIASWPAAVIAAHRGELEPARTLAERGLADAARPHVAAAGFEWVLGFGELSRGDPVGALEHLERAESVYAGLGILEPVQQWFLPGPARRAAGSRCDRTGRATARSVGGAGARARPALGARGRGPNPCAPPRACGRPGRGLRVLRRGAHRARTAEGSLPARQDDPGARRDRAAREASPRRTGDTGAGARALRRPAPPLWAEKARAELARIGGRTSSPAS